MVGAVSVETQRRLDLQHVRALRGGQDDHPELAHPLADRSGLCGCRLERFPVAHKLDAEVEPCPVHRSDERMPMPQLTKTLGESRSDLACIALDVVIDHG